ncbi:MAG: hypothetical protein CL946_10250 [Ectothiorhodospiraceae bacterium]|nr:hypothetical protein [Ectothiorhodospiraceae bacterium]
MGKRIELRYGSSSQTAVLPDSWTSIPLGAEELQSSRSERDIVFDALSNPVGSPALETFAAAGETVGIIVSDKTRYCRTEFVLPLLLERLHDAGIRDSDIVIIFANGTHPPQTEAEKRTVLGDEVYEHYTILENHSREEGEFELVGTTRFGTAVELNNALLRVDKVLAIGTILHHYFAGYGGGAKLLFPGCASYNTAVQNHRRTLTEDGYFHPSCRDGVLDGNPVADDIWDAVRFFPPCFYFATILDAKGKLVNAVCGDLEQAHRKGIRIVDELYAVEVESEADVVVVSAGGYPKDINLIQSHKTLQRASYALKKGGTLICLAECRDGIGNPAFLEWFAHPSFPEMRKAVLNNYKMNAHTAVSLRQKAEDFTILFVSSLPREDVERTGMQFCQSLEEALSQAAMRHDTARCYIIESGALTVPRLANS